MLKPRLKHGLFCETLYKTPIKTALQLFEEKRIAFSNTSFLQLGKNISIAMQNVTESPKKIS